MELFTTGNQEMRHYWILIIVGTVVATGVLLWKQPTCDYFRREYPMLFWTGLIAFVATFSGVTLAFQMETGRQLQSEKDAFRHKLVGLLYETSNNLRNIREMREGFTPTGVNIKHLTADVGKQVLVDSGTYQHGARGLFEAVWIMVDSIDTYNRYSDFARLHFEQSGQNTEKTLKDVNGALDQTEYRIRVAQKVLDIYNVERFQTILWKEPQYEQIQSWVSGKKNFSAELEQMRKEEKPKAP